MICGSGGIYNDQNMDAISHDLSQLMLPSSKKMSSYSENNMRGGDPNGDSTNHTVMPPVPIATAVQKRKIAPKTSTSRKFKSSSTRGQDLEEEKVPLNNNSSSQIEDY